MALATQCPHCGTVFRVAADQLKLRGGMVRCGKCRQVFDGTAALVDISLLKAQQDAAAQGTPGTAPQAAPETGPEPVAPPPEARPQTEASGYALDFDLSLPPLPETSASQAELPEPPQLVIDFDLDLTPPAAPQAAEEEAPAAVEEPHADAAQEQAEAPAAQAEPEEAPVSEWPATPADEGEAAVERAEDAHDAELVPSAVAGETIHPAAPLPDYTSDEEVEEPGFVTRVRRKEKLSRVSRVLMAVGGVLLLAALAAQAAITFGSLLAARYPGLKPALVSACSVLQCRIALPERIDALAVETGELQTLGGDTFSFATVLRNQGALVQAWPHLELSLTDASDVTLVRRVIAPKEYLPPRSDIAKGFAPRSEQSIKVYFELSQVKASGYKIAIFYP